MEEFGFGTFDDFFEEKCQPQQIQVVEDVNKANLVDRLRRKETCIYTPVAGNTKLHHAIRTGNHSHIDALLEVYREDFDKVRDHLVVKYGWDAEDKIWFKKTILVASTEGQCQRAKSLENLGIEAEDFRRAVLVLLKYSVNGEEVAVLHPNETNRSVAAIVIKTLIPNGFLSWSYVCPEGKPETFMEAAATKGMRRVIDRLYKLGAPIAIPGHNPLLQAIRNNRKEMVSWLLTEHIDHFDCTLRDGAQHNALVAALQNNNADLFDLVLEKMITYRMKYFDETEEAAFQEIFHVEQEKHRNISIFTFVKQNSPILKRVEKAVRKYNLKLSNQRKQYVVLKRLIKHKVALDYCIECIRNDPQLLGLQEHETLNILQTLIRYKHLDFVRQMYSKQPDVKSFFNADGAFETLRRVLYEGCYDVESCETTEFILEHHGDFFRANMDKLKDNVFCCSYCAKDFYGARYDYLVECFPALRESLEAMCSRVKLTQYYYGVQSSFATANIDVTNLDQIPEPYSTVRGSNGETLLHWAVDKDDRELFLQILNAGCELDLVDNYGNHPVHLVKSEEMLDLIIDRHPEGRNVVQRTNSDGCTVLHKICQQYLDCQQFVNLLEKVIEYGANVHQRTKTGESAVFFVEFCQMLDVLRKHGVQLDITNNSGQTALERQLRNNNMVIAIQLFGYVHDLPSFKQHSRKYLEHLLIPYGNLYTFDTQVIFEQYPEAARIMLDSVYEHSHEEASRLFAKACGFGFTYVVELFLDGNYELDFNCKDMYENTPLLGLICYLNRANARIIKRLLEKKVDLTVRDRWGRDALMALVWRYRSMQWDELGLETVQLLLDHGAAIDTTDTDGNTPLHLAFLEGQMELVELLIQNGADLNSVNKEGKRPLEMAASLEQELYYFYLPSKKKSR